MAAKRDDMFDFFDPSRAKGPHSGPDIGQDKASQPMSVSLLVARIKQALADAMPVPVTVVGELSNVKLHDSGHVYFRLKDSAAAIDAVMFRAAAGKLKFTPTDGLEVVVEGHVDVYDARGQLQLYVERMTPMGAGSLELAFRQLKEKLQAEGLFDAASKKPIPRFPRAVGVITSQTGAAVRDISRTLRRRWPAAEVYLLATPVQGEGAAGQIAECIRLMDASASALGIDTIIVARGGGSLEDLWAFNEEAVARAVFAAGTPIISGVGHEVDVTICDLVADVRAATPTAAAELAVPDASAVHGWLSEAATRATRRMRQRLDEARLALESIRRSAVFRDPLGRVRTRMQRVDEFAHRLRGGVRHRVAQARRSAEPPAVRLAALHPARLCDRGAAKADALAARLRWALGGRSKRAGDALAGIAGRLAALHPARLCDRGAAKVDALAARLRWALGGRSKQAGDALVGIAGRLTAASPVNRIRLACQQIDGAARQLDAMSYRRVLRRGFSVTRSKAGRILRAASQALAGEMIETELADGRLSSKVAGPWDNPGEPAAQGPAEAPAKAGPVGPAGPPAPRPRPAHKAPNPGATLFD
jgi:exodeoxyribonuclease VII large subunit